MKELSKNVQKALNLLRVQYSNPKEVMDLAKELKGEKAFNYARRILSLVRNSPDVTDDEGLKLDQQLTICTYKDQDLPLVERLEQALQILKKGRPALDFSSNQETLSIAGAIYKRKWEADSQKRNLELALFYYQKAYLTGGVQDFGYAGINTAYVLDLLAHQENKEGGETGTVSESALYYQQKANEIREELVSILPGLSRILGKTELEQQWWFVVTVAEAYFGLQQYEHARSWLQKAMQLPATPEWQLESTTKQLAQLALLQQHQGASKMPVSPAWDVLMVLTQNNATALQTAFSGKVGLALSGGGFRASLYHIGVLARLAELDMLRHVEVLSCVSGGSIIGAYYYLEVRHLLQTKEDSEVSQQDYIDIVERLSHNFLAGVQRNIRTRVAAHWWQNLKMLWSKEYSRTVRAGELYEQELFSRVQDRDKSKTTEERWLNGLIIKPMGKNGQPIEKFTPKYENWRRQAKVPILILNATTLNTGHNWQFTATWMGESPSSIQEIDGNYRLRRMYYNLQGEEKYHRKIRLGQAVAASACVPGLFEPLTLSNLYENKTVRLVDGGVHDNQGICGLLDQDCSVLLVSDASGQMSAEDDPSSSLWGVPLRANNILMERVRNSQYQDMETRFRSGLLKGFMFIHLKLELEVETVDWINCEDPSDVTMSAKRTGNFALTSYGIRKDIQQHLAAIRTDLDSFNDTEAFAIMASGYQMTLSEFPKGIKNFPALKTRIKTWNFTSMIEILKQPEASVGLINLFQVAKERFFKIWRLSETLRYLAMGLAIVCLGLAGWLVFHLRDKPVITVGELGLTILVSLLGLVIGKFFVKIIRYRETAIRFATGIGLITIGWLMANLHLLFWDKMYLKRGRIVIPNRIVAQDPNLTSESPQLSDQLN